MADEELNLYDEIEIEDCFYDETLQIYHHPCPCGDRFEVSAPSTELTGRQPLTLRLHLCRSVLRTCATEKTLRAVRAVAS